MVRFSDKESHQVFIEPEGLDTNEMYVQGLSSSLPVEVQIAVYRTVPGMERVEIMRPAYAIEYDCIDSTQLKLSLESREVEGLFMAGQINGSSGYEEAAAQGIIAGINAVQYIRQEEPLILDRSDAYIGVLIDDLVTKGTPEPYRMMTSRAEYRLLLRQDNADMRLTEKAYRIGLAGKERYDRLCYKQERIQKELERLRNTIISPSDFVNQYLLGKSSSPLKSGIQMYNLLKRPEISFSDLIRLGQIGEEIEPEIQEQLEIHVKYEGYIQKQLKQVEQFKKMEKVKILPDMDYSQVKGLKIESVQKLQKLQPENLGQASRISGVSPADISVLMVYLEKRRREKRNNEA